MNCTSDLKNLANSQPSASNFKHFSRSLFFLTVGQNNFGYKTPFQDQFLNGGIKAHLSNDDRQELLKKIVLPYLNSFFSGPVFQNTLIEGRQTKIKGLFTSGDVYYNCCRDIRLQIPRCVAKISLA